MSETASSEDEALVATGHVMDDEQESEADAAEAYESEEEQDELEAWRQVHSRLIKAVSIAREAVAAKKLQRRYWLEEICANLDDQGKLVATSVWKRPVPPKKTGKRAAGGSASATKKRKKKADTSPANKPAKKRKTKKDSETPDDESRPKARKIRLKLSKSSSSLGSSQGQEATVLGASQASQSSLVMATEVDGESTDDDENEVVVEAEPDDGDDSEAEAHEYPSHHGSSATPSHAAHPGYMASNYDNSPTIENAAGSPYPAESNPPAHTSFLEGGMQAGLNSQDFYSTYSAGGEAKAVVAPAGDSDSEESLPF